MKELETRLFIVHGWASSPEDAWFPWLKQALGKENLTVSVPALPNPKEPKIDEWVSVLANVVGNPDPHTFFVGHSLGCNVILKYLEGFSEGARFGGALFVAGRLTKKDGFEIDTQKIKNLLFSIEAFFSDDDYYIPTSEAKKFQEELDARITILHSRGHFSRKENLKIFPEALEAVLRLARNSL